MSTTSIIIVTSLAAKGNPEASMPRTNVASEHLNLVMTRSCMFPTNASQNNAAHNNITPVEAKPNVELPSTDRMNNPMERQAADTYSSQ